MVLYFQVFHDPLNFLLFLVILEDRQVLYFQDGPKTYKIITNDNLIKYLIRLTAGPGSPGFPGGPISPTSPRAPVSPLVPLAPVKPMGPCLPGSPGRPMEPGFPCVP